MSGKDCSDIKLCNIRIISTAKYRLICHRADNVMGFQWKIETPPPCRVQRQIVKIASAWCERGPSGRLSSGRYALGRMPHSTDPFYREQFHMISLRNENDLRIGMTV